MYIGVIEWSSDSLRLPSVIVSADLAGVLRQTGRECRGFIFDGGGEIDAHRDTFREDMTEAELVDWYSELWDASTDCALTVYRARTENLAEGVVLGDGDQVSLYRSEGWQVRQ